MAAERPVASPSGTGHDTAAQTSRGFPAPTDLAERTLHADDAYIVVKLSKYERRLLDPNRSGVHGRFCLLADPREGSYELVRYSDG